MTDPRIHERRVRVARERGRLRRRVLIGGLVLVTIVAGGLVALHSSLFGARHVEVSGAAHVSTPAVIEAAGLAGSPPLVDLSASLIARRVEALPWVDKAEVELSWPTTVHIALTERTPVVVLAAGSGFAVCDRTGRVLEDVATRPASLPEMTAEVPPPRPGRFLPRRLRVLAAVAGEMPESMVPKISALSLGARGVTISLRGGLVAWFGNGSRAGDKFLALATVLKRADLSGIATIDLRVFAQPVLIPSTPS